MPDASNVLEGTAGITGVIRLDLGQSGLQTVDTITIVDDGVVSGGSSGFSGFDLDFVRLSTEFIEQASAVDGLPALDRFAFDADGVTLSQGFLRPYANDFPEELRTGFLFGTTGVNAIDFDLATPGTRDASSEAIDGSLSIGEGGAVTFHLTEPLDPAGVFLYIGERFANDLPRVILSGRVPGDDGDTQDGPTDGTDAVPPPGGTPPVGSGGTGDGGSPAPDDGPEADEVGAGSSGLSAPLTGTEGDDELVLDEGANAGLGEHDAVVNGGGGNDTIRTGSGRDTLIGGAGADTLAGGPDRDVFRATLAEIQGDRIQDFSPFDTLVIPDAANLEVNSRIAGEDTVLSLDVDGPPEPDATLTLAGVHGGRFLTSASGDGGTAIQYIDTLSLLYAGYFGRAPDPAGYDFWGEQFLTGVQDTGNPGRVFVDIANSFAIDHETRDLYPFLADPRPEQVESFLQDVYLNLFNRELGGEGLAYWGEHLTAELAAGRPVGRIIVDIISGARDTAEHQDLTTVLHKSQAAWFYRTEYPQESLDPWKLDEHGQQARDTLADVDATTASVDAAVSEVAALFDGTGDDPGLA